jgi:hypothetical protein
VTHETDAPIESVDKDLRHLVKAARHQGWRVLLTNKHHLRWLGPKGHVLLTSNRHTQMARRIRADLERLGLRLNEHKREEKMSTNGATTNLGEALEQAARAAEAALPVIDKSLPTRRHVLNVYEKIPTCVWRNEEVIDRVMAAGCRVSRVAVQACIKALWVEGRLHKVGRGRYQLKASLSGGTGPAPKALYGLKDAGHVTTVRTAPLEAPSAAEALVAGSRTGDEAVDKDLAVLDAALVGLAQVEELVRRYRGIIAEAQQLKRLLSGVKL